MDAFAIFKAVGVAKSIAAYLGFIDSVSYDMKKLLHQAFNSGLRNLEYASTASGENQMHYLRKAQDDFISSFSVERDENLISAYVGAAMCQYLLGDRYNARTTLDKISGVELSKVAKTDAGWNGNNTGRSLAGRLAYFAVNGEWDEVVYRKNQFREFKNKALTARID